MSKYRVKASTLASEAVAETISISGARLSELPDGLPHLRIEPMLATLSGLEVVNENTAAFGHATVQVSRLRLKLKTGGGLSFDETGALQVTGGTGGGVAPIATKDNITTRFDSGFYETATATTAEGWPTNTNGYYHLISSTFSLTEYYALQLAAPSSAQEFYLRVTVNNGSQAWSRIVTNSGTWAISVTGSASSITGSITIGQISATGTPSSSTYLRGDGTWATVSGGGGSGTVTSVAVSGGTTGLTTSGGPITTNGTITIAGTLVVANGGTGATDAATARSNLGANNATNLTTGTVASARLSGAYTGITGLGTLSSLAVTGAVTVASTWKVGGLTYSTVNPSSTSGVPDGALWVVYS